MHTKRISASLFIILIFTLIFFNGCGKDDQTTVTVTKPWTKQLGTSSAEVALGVAVDNSGNIYVAGYTTGGLDGNTNAGGIDIFLVKYDAAGTKQWTRQLGTSSDDYGYSIAVDTSGNIYVTGRTGGGLDGNTNAGVDDMFLVKYDAAGTKQWSRQLGTPSSDWGCSVAIDTNGNIYVTGVTGGSLDGKIRVDAFYMFLVKYDATGTKQWTRQLDTPSDGCSVAVDTSGNIYVTGHTSGGLDGNTYEGGSDMFLVKYDSAGTKQWTQQLGTPSVDYGYSVAVDASGDIYVTGWTYGSLDGNTNAGDNDIFLVKYDAAGAKQWTRQLGTSSDDRGQSVAVDTSGNIYVTGWTGGGLDGNTNAGDEDMFLVKYDAAGTKQWTRQLGTSSTDQGLSVAVDTSENIYVTGDTLGGLDGNTNAGNWDMFLVKYDKNGVKQ